MLIVGSANINLVLDALYLTYFDNQLKIKY
jgi:hypothetical protein